MSELIKDQEVSEAEAVVRQFLKDWELGFVEAFKTHLHDDVLYQNTGFEDKHGKAAALTIIDYYLSISEMPFGRVEYIGIAASGSTVLTERIDHLYNEDRSRTHSTRIMGGFEVKDGKIIRYSDYFDPRQFLSKMD